ncbi:hypothetical protein [Burkholderia sp. 3C]
MVTTNLRNLTNAPVDTARTDPRQPAPGQRQDHGDNTRRVSMGRLSNMPPSFAAQQRAAGGSPRNRTASGADASAHSAHVAAHHPLAPQHHAMQFIAQHAPSLPGSAELAEQYDISALGPMTDTEMIGMTGHAAQHAPAPPGVDPDVHRVQQEMVQHMTRKIGQVQDEMVKNLEKAKVKDDDEDD